MSGSQSPALSTITVNLSDGIDDMLVSQLTLSEAFRDSPNFRNTLAKAELIAAQIRANYRVTMESCRQAVKTGEAYANALSGLAQSLNMDLLPQSTCSVSDIPSRWSGVNCDPSRGLQQVNQLLVRVSQHTAALSTRLREPERYLSDACTQLDQLFGMRQNFHQVGERLDNGLQRSISTSRTSIDTTNPADGQINELRNTFRHTGSVYLSALRAAISSTPMITYLRSACSVVSAELEFADKLHEEFSPPDTSAVKSSSIVGIENSDMLLTFLSKLITWAETNRRVTETRDQYAERQSVDETTSNPVISDGGPRIEGYLTRRAGRRTWRVWGRRWFRLHENRLSYCKRIPSLTQAELQNVTDQSMSDLRACLYRTRSDSVLLLNGSAHPVSNTALYDSDVSGLTDTADRLLSHCIPQWKVMESDLRLCTARDVTSGMDRRFTFELISPGNRINVLQADSYDQRERWVEALRSGLLHYQEPNNNNNNNNTYHLLSTDRLTSTESQISTGFASPRMSSLAVSNSYLRSPQSRDVLNGSSVRNVAESQQSIGDYDQLRSQGGVILWREPDESGNRFCADCSAEGASWASINLGVTLCTQCAAAHRSLGVHVSKIRSLTLDNWEPELLHLMLNLGNLLVNRVYEANMHNIAATNARLIRPTVNSSIDQRRLWARAKWAQCQFVRLPLLDPVANKSTTQTSAWIRELYTTWHELRRHNQATDSGQPTASQPRVEREQHRWAILNDLCSMLDQLLEQKRRAVDERNVPRRSTLLRSPEQDNVASSVLSVGARLGCPPLMLLGLASGAHPDGVNKTPLTSASGRPSASSYTPLIWAVRSGSMAACEFLLLNGANIDAIDNLGRTALHHACELQRVHLVCLFLRRRANRTLADHKGRQPLDVAVQLTNADIVTLLRLQRLHDEDREFDQSLSDETVMDIFRDYTSRAYYAESDSEPSDNTVTEIPHATSSPTINIITIPAQSRTTVTATPTTNGSTLYASPSNRRRSRPISPTSPTLTADSRRRFGSPIHRRAISPSTRPSRTVRGYQDDNCL